MTINVSIAQGAGATSWGADVSLTAHLAAAPSDGSAAANELEHDDNDGNHQQ
jgi:hypothetical protein